jgi:hypothetical protein
LVTLPIDNVEVVIGKPAPLFFDLALYLFPISFHTIPVHDALLASMCSTNNDPPANVPAGGRVALSQSIGGIRR